VNDAPFLPQEIIRAKRDGASLDATDIYRFIKGLVDGKVSEGQAAAFAMAVFFRGMSRDERVALTRAMMSSGQVLRWDLPGPALDKHSTGGVGDNVSLILAPAVAACGAFVPMISGRGLGHTGGTLDKLESIPGYRAQPNLGLFRRVVRQAGCAIIGQTGDLAPADRRLYAIRDVTATVESIDLITASILSKKLAAGLDGLVLDVKWGSGAFMMHFEEACDLARSLVEVANGAGLPSTALLTDMNEPLADAAGNALEALHAVAHLTGKRRQPRMSEIVASLGAEMLVTGGLAEHPAAGKRMIGEAIASGAAAERFARMVAMLGGPSDVLERPRRHFKLAPLVRAAASEHEGFVAAIDTRALGLAVIALGGGRTRPQDAIDPSVGLSKLAEIGAEVANGAPLALVHARDDETAEMAIGMLRAAYKISASPQSPSAGPVSSRMDAPG
jgi:thymidine phosphorylase